jgi:hypothetical protein
MLFMLAVNQRWVCVMGCKPSRIESWFLCNCSQEGLFLLVFVLEARVIDGTNYKILFSLCGAVLLHRYILSTDCNGHYGFVSRY